MKPILDFLIIDNKKYRVAVLSIRRKAPILDKFAERTEDGTLHREVIGTYFNYEIKFGSNFEREDDYDKLFEVLTSPEPYHTITVPYGHRGSHTYQAYISNVGDDVKTIRDGETLWENLTANFLAQRPARR